MREGGKGFIILAPYLLAFVNLSLYRLSSLCINNLFIIVKGESAVSACSCEGSHWQSQAQPTETQDDIDKVAPAGIIIIDIARQVLDFL